MALQVMSGFLPCSYNSFPPLRAPFWRHSLSFRASSHNLSEASSCEGGLAHPHSPSTGDISALKILLDQELASGNERKALDLIASSGLRGFGTASQVPQRQYSIADLRLNDIEPSSFLSPVDSTLGQVQRNLQIAAVAGSIVLWQTLHPSQFQVLSAFLALTFISGVDLVLNNGGMEALILDTIGRILSRKYKNRVAQEREW